MTNEEYCNVRGCKFGVGCDKWTGEGGKKVWLDSYSALSSGERSDS